MAKVEEERDRCEGEEVTRPPPTLISFSPSALRPFPQSSDLPNVKHNKQLTAHQASIYHHCLWMNSLSTSLLDLIYHPQIQQAYTYCTEVRAMNTNLSVIDLYQNATWMLLFCNVKPSQLNRFFLFEVK